MKKIFIAILLLASTGAYAQNNNDNPGVIIQAQCDKNTGYGIVEVQRNIDTVLTSTWYKVNSKNLCGKKYNHNLFIGNVSEIIKISADNSIGSDYKVNQFIFNDDGYLINLKDAGQVNASTFIDGAETTKRINAQSAHNWYFSTK